MCKFFSFVMNDKGKIFYFNKEQRLAFQKENPNMYLNDSHSSICDYYNLDEDEVNKYEYLGELDEDTKCFNLDNDMQRNMDSFLKGLELKELVTESNDAYLYCCHIKDDPEIRKLITNSNDAYYYCRDVKDRPSVRKLITDSYYAYGYCLNVKDRPSIRKIIIDSNDAYLYCQYIKDNPKIRKLITDSYYALLYCRNVKDRPSIRKLITNNQ